MPDAASPSPVTLDLANTRVRVAAGVLVAFIVAACLASVKGTWAAADYLHEQAEQTRRMVEKVEAIDRRMAEAAAQAWTRRDMREWGYELERLNRARGLIVPGLSPVPASAHDSP